LLRRNVKCDCTFRRSNPWTDPGRSYGRFRKASVATVNIGELNAS
jgi:hypothetical protein